MFRLLDWGDEVRLRVRADGVITRPTPVAGVPEGADLTVRAARLLAAETGTALGAEIAVAKRIPDGWRARRRQLRRGQRARGPQ